MRAPTQVTAAASRSQMTASAPDSCRAAVAPGVTARPPATRSSALPVAPAIHAMWFRAIRASVALVGGTCLPYPPHRGLRISAIDRRVTRLALAQGLRSGWKRDADTVRTGRDRSRVCASTSSRGRGRSTAVCPEDLRKPAQRRGRADRSHDRLRAGHVHGGYGAFRIGQEHTTALCGGTGPAERPGPSCSTARSYDPLFQSDADWISPGYDDEIFAGGRHPMMPGSPQSRWLEDPPPAAGR